MSSVTGKERIKDKKFDFYNIQGLDQVEEVLYNTVSANGGQTQKICFDLIGAGGKRLRPLLVLNTAQCFGTLNEKVIKTAAAFELIHMASLVHDDIIDESNIRRNKPSLNAEKGNLTSVLVGDYLFAKAFEILAANQLIPSMNLVVEAITEMCDGEIVQADNRFNFNQSVEDYYERIYKKTGALIAACCQAGAIAGGATDKEIDALKIYGTHIGYAFQIIDDILDFTGDPVILGKPVGSDLKEGNITLPVLKLMMQEEYKRGLERIFEKYGFTEDAYKEILRLLQDSYALEEAHKDAVNSVRIAKEALKNIKDSNSRYNLSEIAEKILIRKK
ncbi:heptaprenyl diphosphate synthase [Anaerosolibacter carboniphilus]|uniref:Heptaprenyl diphosphate synthase n=1 Tax=Anaerosolibacter carboniphilus TaxID=1417629 RepID=A0A841KWH5_9FIRM|nr:polyprenyl synthetase family protein [Anaerosolibacter carboniphilus]MBB6218036.1 heptaprenyl diphosphate synthase [Anaerosolibacter carboniphilus]